MNYFIVSHCFPTPRVETAFDEWQVFWLTPYPEAFPMFQIRHQWQKMFPRYINGASQQRDCLGLTPNSLLIRMTRIFIRNQFGTKIKKKTERERIINKKCKIQSPFSIFHHWHFDILSSCIFYVACSTFFGVCPKLLRKKRRIYNSPKTKEHSWTHLLSKLKCIHCVL